MGGGNGQKSKMARERNAEKNKGAKGTCIHPSLQSPRPDSPSLPVLPCSPSRLIPSISSPYLLAGSQLEANKKAMNIQVRMRAFPPPSPLASPRPRSVCHRIQLCAPTLLLAGRLPLPFPPNSITSSCLQFILDLLTVGSNWLLLHLQRSD